MMRQVYPEDAAAAVVLLLRHVESAILPRSNLRRRGLAQGKFVPDDPQARRHRDHGWFAATRAIVGIGFHHARRVVLVMSGGQQRVWP